MVGVTPPPKLNPHNHLCDSAAVSLTFPVIFLLPGPSGRVSEGALGGLGEGFLLSTKVGGISENDAVTIS